jgi:general secretion pathway protein I
MKHKKLNGCPVSRDAEEGFTLLEVLVAMVILSVTLAAIFELFSANLKGIEKSDDYAAAVMVAESRMREILDDDNLAESAWNETIGDRYRVDAVIRSAANERTENLSVKLLEINLTLSWTTDSKVRRLDLRTLKVVNKQI